MSYAWTGRIALKLKCLSNKNTQTRICERFTVATSSVTLPRRFFSSTETPEKQTFQRIVDQTKTWNSQDWQEAMHSLVYWRDHELQGTEKVWNLWTLLDRAVHQLEVSPNIATDIDADRNSFGLNSSLLHSMVMAWTVHPSHLSARELLEKLHSYQTLIPPSQTDLELYNIILEKALHNNEHNVHELAQSILHHSTLQPNTRTFTIAMQALAKSELHDAPQRAELLLQQIKDLSTTNDHNTVTPNTQLYSALISIYTNTKYTTDAALQRANELLREMPNPNTLCYNAVLDAWSKSDQVGAADQCLQIFLDMKHLYNNNRNDDLKPNAASYRNVMAALAKTGRATETEAMLRELISEYEINQDSHIMPDRTHFNSAMEAWAKSGQKGAPQRAEALLEEMHAMVNETNKTRLQPNKFSYNAVLHAWAKSKEPLAPARAEAMLQQMHDYDKAGVPDMSPDRVTYSVIMNNFANVRTKEAAFRAKAILDEMIDKFHSGNDNVKPNTIAFNTVMNAFAKSRDENAAVQAEEIYTRMKSFGVIPNRQTFSTLISAWANSRDPRAAQHAETLWREMRSVYDAGDKSCTPDTILMNSIIHACSTTNDPQSKDRALAIVEEMKRLGNAGHRECMPDLITYNSLLNVISKSRGDKAAAAMKIISEMEERSIQPDVRSLNTVIVAAAFSNRYERRQRVEAFRIAVQMIHRIHSELTPTAETYSFFFRAAAGLGYDQEVEFVYKLCCKAGLRDHALVKRAYPEAAPRSARK